MNQDIEKMRAQANAAQAPKRSLPISTTDWTIEGNITTPNAILPEFIFVHHFLDFFRDLISGAFQNLTDHSLYYKWIELSGSPYSEVDIVDEHGKVVYSVPPLMVRASMNPNVNIEYNEMHTTYLKKRDRLPAEGERYLNSNLGYVAKMVNNDGKQQIISRWNHIFARYADNESSATGTASAAPVTGQDLGLDYD